MNKINTEILDKCIKTLELSYQLLCAEKDINSINYEMYRNSTIKSFEMTLEQSAKLLKKKLLDYFSSKRAIDSLVFKDIFHHALKHNIMAEEEVIRWYIYRDNFNNTAHDYGLDFAQKTLLLIIDFLNDAKRLKQIIDHA